MRQKHKTIGVGIDGVLRDVHSRFDSVYRKVFIFNEGLVKMNEMFELVPDGPEDEKARNEALKLAKQKITLPVDTFDLMNHYYFESREAFAEFLDSYSFEIFGMASQFPRSMDAINRIQAIGESTGAFDVVLFSTEKKNARISTYHFLAKAGCKVGMLKFVGEHVEKWDYCDILIDDCPYVFESRPKGKVSIKIRKPYNAYSESDHSFDSPVDIDDGFLADVLGIHRCV